ncbi:hypothetical protein LY76DRAFT_332805 [Colletotrichum caudatum]|nr:hypothetical protein LY76DRAFT_332805 [Colletotrichum caudatum]
MYTANLPLFCSSMLVHLWSAPARAPTPASASSGWLVPCTTHSTALSPRHPLARTPAPSHHGSGASSRAGQGRAGQDRNHLCHSIPPDLTGINPTLPVCVAAHGLGSVVYTTRRHKAL